MIVGNTETGGLDREADAQWQALWAGVRELAQWFADGMVLIGGLAVWLHARQAMQERLLDVSHDADFYLSLADYADLRDLEEVTANRRLGKHQIIKNGIDFDIYVEKHNDLVVPYDEALAYSVVIEGLRCACLEHLMALKCRAWLQRAASAKGQKDERDVARLLVLMGQAPVIEPQAAIWIDEASQRRLRDLVGQPAVFRRLCAGNAHEARQWQARAQQGWSKLDAALCQSSQDRGEASDAVPR